jgi:hypothetical protein
MKSQGSPASSPGEIHYLDKESQIGDRITGRLTSPDLEWIERQLPSITSPFARLLILILLCQVRLLRSGSEAKRSKIFSVKRRQAPSVRCEHRPSPE